MTSRRRSTTALTNGATIAATVVMAMSAGACTDVDLLIVDAAVFDAHTGVATNGMAVAVADGVIRAVGRTEDLASVDARRTLDAAGRLLIPGLIDTHAHLINVLATSFSPGGGGIADLTMAPDSIAAYRRTFAEAYLPHGVTVVRDAGSSEEYLPLMRAWAVADASAPDFYPCGGALVSPEPGRTPYAGHAVVRDSADAAATVQVYHDAGFRYVKLYWRLREPEFRAALRRAAELEMVPFAHIDRGVFTIDAALDLGLRHYEHIFTLGSEVLGGRALNAIATYAINDVLGGETRGAFFMAIPEGFNRIGANDERMLSLIARLAEAGASVTPTLHVVAKPLGLTDLQTPPIGDFDDTSDWTDEQLARARRGYEIMASYVLALYRAGVPLAVGTDAVTPGRAVLSELLLLQEAGIPMADVLRIGTLGSAEVIELSDRYGSIEPGKRGHLVLFERNPLDDPKALLGAKTVIKDGLVWETR